MAHGIRVHLAPLAIAVLMAIGLAGCAADPYDAVFNAECPPEPERAPGSLTVQVRPSGGASTGIPIDGYEIVLEVNQGTYAIGTTGDDGCVYFQPIEEGTVVRIVASHEGDHPDCSWNGETTTTIDGSAKNQEDVETVEDCLDASITVTSNPEIV